MKWWQTALEVANKLLGIIGMRQQRTAGRQEKKDIEWHEKKTIDDWMNDVELLKVKRDKKIKRDIKRIIDGGHTMKNVGIEGDQVVISYFNKHIDKDVTIEYDLK